MVIAIAMDTILSADTAIRALRSMIPLYIFQNEIAQGYLRDVKLGNFDKLDDGDVVVWMVNDVKLEATENVKLRW